MRKQWTRGMAILLVLTLVLALAGCGGDVPDSSVDTSTGDTTTTTTTTTVKKETTIRTTVIFDWKDEGDTIANPAGSDDPVAKYTTTFDEATGTLTVSGKGRLKDLYPRKWEPPGIGFGKISEFINADYEVQRLVIGEGITYLENCFNDMMALEEIIFPSTLKSICGLRGFGGTDCSGHGGENMASQFFVLQQTKTHRLSGSHQTNLSRFI